MLLDCCTLHPELMAGVSGAVRAHSLWVEDVSFEEIAGCWLLKPVLVPSSQRFARFHQSSSLIWVILTVIPLIWHIAIVVMT